MVRVGDGEDEGQRLTLAAWWSACHNSDPTDVNACVCVCVQGRGRE